MKLVISCIVAASVMSCGQASKDNNQEQQQTVNASEEIQMVETVSQRPASMPGMMVVKVKEDVNGNVLPGSDNAEMRVTDSAVSELSATNVVSVFEAAKNANPNSDDLDADSSEGQFYWGYGARRYRRWNWGGYGYRAYRPYYYNRGYGYGYRYYNNYRWGGFRYYCYW